jgi:hypothetical protein
VNFLVFTDDPIGNFIQGDALSNSVSLLLIGLFSKVETGHLFYTADLEVVIDIIQRRLKDYGPGDAVCKNIFGLLVTLVHLFLFTEEI